MKSDEKRRKAMRFAQALAKRRQELGLSQIELTRRVRPLLTSGIKFDRASMSRYESGQNMPRPEVLQALAAVLEIPPHDLLPPEAEVTQIGPSLIGLPDGKCRLTLDMVMPADVALEIFKMLAPLNAVEKKDS